MEMMIIFQMIGKRSISAISIRNQVMILIVMDILIGKSILQDRTLLML
jgi:hypothetical protein